MTTVLCEIQGEKNNLDLKVSRENLLEHLEKVYKQMVGKMEVLVIDSVSSQMFHNYHTKISSLVSSFGLVGQKLHQTADQQQKIDENLQASTQTKTTTQQQPSYLFLRNTWLSRSQQSPNQKQQDPQDHIDRINKAVAMIRQQTLYMIKKENYLYQKQESNYELILSNPFFMRVKQELQKEKMMNEELVQRCRGFSEIIEKLNKDKILLENSLRSYKKKFQQMEKSWIEVSKKNICLQQEALVLRAQGTRGRLSTVRDKVMNPTINTPLNDKNTSLMFSSHRKLTQQQQQLDNSNNKTIMDNLFIDIKLNIKSDQQCLKDVTDRVNSSNNGNHRYSEAVSAGFVSKVNANQKEQRLHQQALVLSPSDKLIAEVSQLKLKNLRNQTSASRKTLLSARSVDLGSKTSLNKPKFQRTKNINNQNLQQTLMKSVTKDNINLEKLNIIKNPSLITNSDLQNSSILIKNLIPQTHVKKYQIVQKNQQTVETK